jgi:hypothetical protein
MHGEALPRLVIEAAATRDVHMKSEGRASDRFAWKQAVFTSPLMKPRQVVSDPA